MRVTFRVILVSGIFGGFFGVYALALPMELQRSISNDLSDTMNELYDTYLSVSGDREANSSELDVISEVQQVYLNKPKNKVGKRRTVEQRAYVVVKTRQRDKRYISYLTLCHFKICNMGRKRTTRYFHMIRMDDNDS